MSTRPVRGRGRALRLDGGRIDLSHGAGGRATAQLIEELFEAAFGPSGDGDASQDEAIQDHPSDGHPSEAHPSPGPARAMRARALGDDGALLAAPAPGERLVIATDGHVVSPLFFPGGDIGRLAVHGTVNDLAMMGARPMCLTCGFILEEGLALAELARIARSMGEASRALGVPLVAGDTKVVEQGKGDGVFVTTTGLGVLPERRVLGGASARPGDAVLVSGPVGEHGTAILSVRASLGFETDVVSDSAPLDSLVRAMLAAVPSSTELGDARRGLRAMRDPTRGGLATALNEIAQQSGTGMVIDEDQVPVAPQVRAACEFLGLDPLYMACEGRLVAICAEPDAPRLLQAMRAHPLGAGAARIGQVVADDHRFVQLRTAFGGTRVLDWLAGEPLPRIC